MCIDENCWREFVEQRGAGRRWKSSIERKHCVASFPGALQLVDEPPVSG
jgi:hypothetical protein